MDLAYRPVAAMAWLASPRARASLAIRRASPPPELPAARRAWVHAASVGEILSTPPVLDLLEARGFQTVLSTNTPTALQTVREGPRTAFAMPLDFSARVRDAFDRVKPSLLVLMEGELWPNLLAEAERRSVPVLCVNARITERGFRRYRLLGPLFAPTLGRVRAFLAQGQEHAERLAALGVPPERIRVIPNVKAAVLPPARPAWIPEGPPLLAAGSTHAGEEAILLEAWKNLNDWRLLLAPRHPQRFPEVADLLRSRGVAFRRRSDPAGEGAWRVLLLDTVGELAGAYAAAGLAFVGGTLAPVGGHNLLEPARCGVGILVGPHTGHVAEDRARLEAAGGLRAVKDAGDLAGALRELAGDPAERRRMGEAARASSVAGVRQALEAAIAPFLP